MPPPGRPCDAGNGSRSCRRVRPGADAVQQKQPHATLQVHMGQDRASKPLHRQLPSCLHPRAQGSAPAAIAPHHRLAAAQPEELDRAPLSHPRAARGSPATAPRGLCLVRRGRSGRGPSALVLAAPEPMAPVLGKLKLCFLM
jgi:hypothetical protein